jgi:phospholipid/cholesterol/gamma-HCH transport system substrate-binding protein
VKHILASADKISDNLRLIIDGVQAGEGTVGSLFKDKELYGSIKRSVNTGEKVIADIRESSASAKKIVKKVEDSDIVPEVQKIVKHVQEITAQVKTAVDKFESASGEGGVAENLQRTLANANEAMADLSDDTEALKHNFLFRGFFNRRGFFDLDGMTAPEYKNPSFGKGFKKYRIWLESVDLFSKDGKGTEVLSAAGKARLDEALTEILKYPRNGPMMVEGFAAAGSPSQQYLTGRRRAALVQAYIISRFQLRPAYTGIISLGPEANETGVLKDGIGIVAFYK